MTTTVIDAKVCGKCGESKPLDAFAVRTASADGRQSWCRTCCSNWQKENPEKRRGSWNKHRRRYHLRTAYGLTEEQYDQLYRDQHGLCACCGKPPAQGKSLRVDHNHETGVVRGLLCHKCNTGIGLFEENADFLEAAIAYLARHSLSITP